MRPKKILYEKYFGNNSQIEINLIFDEGRRDVITYIFFRKNKF